ncbi:hypothetical protein jhhlp_008779 [Lomentospora prolificans]|uniref:Glutamine amidotransferase domain-containing protein n=1 Tax=Lomentospora prolificans TaxID=41688 RepID=A0A2N3MZ00_9PEZI|nr:hypothetical protein jhhlp_008779 [Lomentospora prolificans]
MMVLETDEPHPDEQKRRGSFAQILHHHFSSAGESHDPPLDIETDKRFVVADKGGRVPKFEDFEGCDAVLITGSMYDAHGNNPWILELLAVLKELWQRRPDIHFSGVCFGHQLLCRLLGASIRPTPDKGWELGHSKISLTPLGQKLFRVDEPFVYLHQMHQDQVAEAPTTEKSGGLLEKGTKVHVWGSSEHTKVQGVYIQGRLFTTQAHLAFDKPMVEREIELRVKSGSITDEDSDDVEMAAATAHLEHDGITVAAAILRFFHFEDDGLE